MARAANAGNKAAANVALARVTKAAANRSALAGITANVNLNLAVATAAANATRAEQVAAAQKAEANAKAAANAAEAKAEANAKAAANAAAAQAAANAAAAAAAQAAENARTAAEAEAARKKQEDANRAAAQAAANAAATAANAKKAANAALVLQKRWRGARARIAIKRNAVKEAVLKAQALTAGAIAPGGPTRLAAMKSEAEITEFYKKFPEFSTGLFKNIMDRTINTVKRFQGLRRRPSITPSNAQYQILKSKSPSGEYYGNMPIFKMMTSLDVNKYTNLTPLQKNALKRMIRSVRLNNTEKNKSKVRYGNNREELTNNLMKIPTNRDLLAVLKVRVARKRAENQRLRVTPSTSGGGSKPKSTSTPTPTPNRGRTTYGVF